MSQEPAYPARIYDRYRPSFPAPLFRILAETAPARKRALDCATGTGKAARALSLHFRSVIALDRDIGMLRSGIKTSSVHLLNCRSERCALRKCSFDLIFAGQALHWFAHRDFYGEVRRLLSPDGIFAAACYQRPQISEDVDRIIAFFFNDILEGYWHPAVKHLLNGYADLPFPFRSLAAPSFRIRASWNIADLFGFLHTWSAVEAYKKDTGSDPLHLVAEDLRAAWGDQNLIRNIQWPVCLLMGKQ